MILKLSGHIGSTASALVDGQLSVADEDRAWSHVLTCPPCRRLVEHEGWIKRQLGSLADPCRTAPSGLVPTLYDVEAWSAVDGIERHSNRRRTALALVGAGSVGAAVLGIVTMTGAQTVRTEVPRTPSPASIRTDLSTNNVGQNFFPGAVVPTSNLAPLRRTAK